jgi:TRAP-type uncharacterized transport system substrate-binding protein
MRAYTLPASPPAPVPPAAFWNEQVRDNLAQLRPLTNVQQTVVSTATYSRQSNVFGDITGLTVTITPTFSTSRILVVANLNWGHTNVGEFYYIKMLRDSTDIFIGDAAGTRPRISAGNDGLASNTVLENTTIHYIDSPATTSAITYKLQVRNHNGAAAGIFYLNRTGVDTDGIYPRAASSITAWELPG